MIFDPELVPDDQKQKKVPDTAQADWRDGIQDRVHKLELYRKALWDRSETVIDSISDINLRFSMMETDFNIMKQNNPVPMLERIADALERQAAALEAQNAQRQPCECDELWRLAREHIADPCPRTIDAFRAYVRSHS